MYADYFVDRALNGLQQHGEGIALKKYAFILDLYSQLRIGAGQGSTSECACGQSRYHSLFVVVDVVSSLSSSDGGRHKC